MRTLRLPSVRRSAGDLRVLHVSPTSFGDDGIFGGGERFPYELAKAMSDECPVTLLTFGRERRSHRDGNLHVRMAKQHGTWKGSEVNPLAADLVPAIAAVDVVHVHQWETVVANQCVVLGRLMGKRIFATDHGGSGPNYWRRLRLHRLLTGFIAVSRFGAGFYPEMQDRTRVSLGGVDTRRFSSDPRVRPRTPGALRGAPAPPQGDRPGDRGLAADGALPGHREALRPRLPPAAAREVAAGKQVEFRENVDDEALVTAYRSSRLALLPSVYRPTTGPPAPRSELLGLTLLEAMACGTPVICTDVGGMPELVDHGHNGFVIDPDDVSAIAPAVCALLTDHALWERMSAAARSSAEALSWTSIARNCLRIYHEVALESVSGTRLAA